MTAVSNHPDPKVRQAANRLLREAGHGVSLPDSKIRGLIIERVGRVLLTGLLLLVAVVCAAVSFVCFRSDIVHVVAWSLGAVFLFLNFTFVLGLVEILITSDKTYTWVIKLLIWFLVLCLVLFLGEKYVQYLILW